MSLNLIGGVVVTGLRMTAIALGSLGLSFAIGQALAAMPVSGLAAAEKQISTNVEDVRWVPGHHWHGHYWAWHHPGWHHWDCTAWHHWGWHRWHYWEPAPVARAGMAPMAPLAPVGMAPVASMAPVDRW